VELLHRTLEPAVAAGVLVELDDDQYLFAHAVVVEVLEAELSPRQRADWLSRLAPRALATSA
jgi:hypothetical protein